MRAVDWFAANIGAVKDADATNMRDSFLEIIETPMYLAIALGDGGLVLDCEKVGFTLTEQIFAVERLPSGRPAEALAQEGSLHKGIFHFQFDN